MQPASVTPIKSRRRRQDRAANARGRAEFAAMIKTAWQEQVESIFEVGNLLEAAKAELPHGEFIIMVKAELPFTRQTANKLMAISDCEQLRNDAHVRHLPATWGTLYELTKLTPEQFAAGIENGAIKPTMKRTDVKALRGNSPASKRPRKTNAIPASVRCLATVRRVVLEAVETTAANELESLFKSLHDELEELRNLATEKQGGKT